MKFFSIFRNNIIQLSMFVLFDDFNMFSFHFYGILESRRNSRQASVDGCSQTSDICKTILEGRKCIHKVLISFIVSSKEKYANSHVKISFLQILLACFFILRYNRFSITFQ